MMTRDAVAQVKEHDSEILSVIKVLGGNVGQYKREGKAAMRAVVSEIYSPPRVTAEAKLLPELKLIPGFALDLTVADSDGRRWDFDDGVMRDRARKRLLDERPMLLVGSRCALSSRHGRGSTTRYETQSQSRGAQESEAALGILC